jgi:outer membrane lipoprotein SlyB
VPMLALGVIAWAQTIRIPDLRERPAAVAPAPKAGEPCERCGVIRSIKEISLQRPVNVPQELGGDPGYSGPGDNMPVGAVISLPFGPGSSKAYVGGVGTPEMRERFSATEYEITIRLDDGGYTMVQRRDGLAYQVGDRVRVQGTQIELLVP